MKKIIIIPISSFADVVTNSSSELFVMNSDLTEEAFMELLYEIGLELKIPISAEEIDVMFKGLVHKVNSFAEVFSYTLKYPDDEDGDQDLNDFLNLYGDDFDDPEVRKESISKIKKELKIDSIYKHNNLILVYEPQENTFIIPYEIKEKLCDLFPCLVQFW